ncbi:hypothetical protein MHYP_G00350360 [Metynnis hypsauchen]
MADEDERRQSFQSLTGPPQSAALPLSPQFSMEDLRKAVTGVMERVKGEVLKFSGGPSLPPSTTPTCRQIGNGGKPEAAESHSAPPFDHRLIIGRPPSSQASLPGRQETEVGHQLRRLTCLKPHQDIWDRPWKPQREPTGSQVRFSSLVIQVRFLDLKVRLVTFIYAVKVRRYLIQ